MKLFPWDSVNPGCIFIGFHLSSAHPLWKLCHKHSAGGGSILIGSANWTPLVVCFTKMMHRRCVTFKFICSLCKSFWKSHSLCGRFAVYLPQGCMDFLWSGPLLISCTKAPNTKQSKRPLLLAWPTSLPGVLPMVNLASKLVLVEFVYFFFLFFLVHWGYIMNSIYHLSQNKVKQESADRWGRLPNLALPRQPFKMIPIRTLLTCVFFPFKYIVLFRFIINRCHKAFKSTLCKTPTHLPKAFYHC